MGIFKRQREKTAPPQIQMRTKDSHPFGMLGDYVPLSGGDTKLYRAVREAIPLVDAAIVKLVRLTGGFTVDCGGGATQREINSFLQRVNVGYGRQGIAAFFESYLDSVFTYGRGVGEIVLAGRSEIAAVICGNVEHIAVSEGDNPLDFKLCRYDDAGRPEPLPYQNLLLFTPLSPEPENPYGVSLLRSMPFLADVLLKIYHAIGVNWERAGNVRFAVVYKPQGDIFDRSLATERSEQIAKEWSAAMQSTKSGSVRDFVAVGDVDIKVIGADDRILDSEVPVRQILEQIVARTGLPPFMLGLSWASTERMSSQQADILTSEITAVRRALEPAVRRICDTWMRIHGKSCDYEILWDDINLQDLEEESRAELYKAQAAYYRARAERETVGGEVE